MSPGAVTVPRLVIDAERSDTRTGERLTRARLQRRPWSGNVTDAAEPISALEAVLVARHASIRPLRAGAREPGKAVS